MRFDMLFHIIPLNKSSGAIRALMGFIPAMYLSMAVEGARIGQFLTANLARYRRFTVRTGDRGSAVLVSVRSGVVHFSIWA